MPIENKYRVHEVAKDFKLSTKEVTNILTKYAKAPKNHMQVLEQEELNIVFDYITSHNQVEDLGKVLEQQSAKQPGKTPKAKESAPKAADAPAAAGSASKTAGKPAEARPLQKAQPKSEEEVVSRTKGKQVHRVDTRGGGNIDLAKYDERIDSLVPEKANKMGHGKEKFTKKNPGGRQFGSKRRQEEQDKMRRLQRRQEMQQAAKKIQLKVLIPDEINVGELAMRLKRTAADVIKELMKMGVMASVSESIDFDTASLVAMEMGAKVEKEVFVTIEERLFDESEDKEENLQPRDPVVVVMGHVDHGKTSLLDAIRKTKVVDGEAGGITQHIGAYRVKINGQNITFLDTPGHAAFTSMRARGAQVTDIAILVVAADDGIMPQTIEAINHAKAAGIPIIVAVNKIDKEGANPDRVVQQLTEHDLVPEEWGGDTIVCQISAKKNQGIDNLLEMVLLTAEVADLKANPDRQAKGTVIEAKLDKGRGPVATILIQNGTLKAGDAIIAGTAVGRVRAMTDDDGRKIASAGPSVPVEIIGLAEVPNAGDVFYAVEDEKMARELVEQRKDKEKEEKNKAVSKVTLDNLFESIQEGNMKELNIIVKADVQGSVEAVKASLEKISNDEVRVRVIHGAVGAINESDIMLASASNAIIVGFNVRPDKAAVDEAAIQGVDMRMYRVIYEAIEEMEQAMRGMLDPKFREAVLGHAEIRQTFKVSGVGTIAGCYVTDGKIVRSSSVRVVRDGIVIFDGQLNSLKRFKDDVKEVQQGFECGMGIEKFNDIKEGDVIEAYIMEEVKA